MSRAEKRQTIERVARAICLSRWAGKSKALWDIIGEDEREEYRRQARAAIEAMREPKE